MRVWGIALLMLSLAFAGCLGEDSGTDADDGQLDDGDDQGDVMDDDVMDDGNATDDGDDPTNGTNTEPVIDTFTASNETGEVPFDVTFEWNASDADGDDLTWTFDADGDGTAESEGALLPFNFTFTYDTAGSYNATLNVTDGEASVEQVIAITATEPEEEGGDGEESEDGGPEPVDETKAETIPLSHPYYLADHAQAVITTMHEAGADGVFFTYNEYGVGAGAKSLSAETLNPDVGAADLDLFVIDPSGAFTWSFEIGVSTESVSVSSPAAGTWVVGGYLATGANANYDLNVKIAY